MTTHDPIDQLPANPRLQQAAIEGGRAAFRMHCVQCHGSGAAGSPGYHNLNDDDWLWGGSTEQLEKTIRYGIRSGHAEAHAIAMPRFGVDQMLESKQMSDVADYVVSRAQPGGDAAAIERGRAIFAEQCSACHGETGKGSIEMGAPNLTDGIWLYGDRKSDILETIRTGRGGVMPSWDGKLDPATIKMLAIYVHSLGGGK